MKAEIVATGTEILLGQITDTNSSWVASELAMLGVDLFWISQIGDNKARMVEVLKRALERSDLILTTGGLGPTEGDITRDSIAEAIGEKMTLDPVSVKNIEERFRRYGRQLTPSTLKQASIIPSAQAIPNSRGTAPGWWAEKNGRIVLALPGPPGELHNMWQTEVLPRLRKKLQIGIILSRTIKTWGIGESNVNDMLLPFLSAASPTVATYVKPDGINIRITAKADNEEQARKIITPVEEQIKTIMKEALWGYDEDTMEGVVASKLKEKGLTLSVMETFSGGELTSTLLEASDAAKYCKGGVTLGSADAFGGFKDIKPGGGESLFKDVALFMAESARQHFKTDVGVSVSVRAEPAKIDDRILDVVNIGLISGDSHKLVTFNQPRDRVRTRRMVVSTVLFEVIKMLTRGDYFGSRS